MKQFLKFLTKIKSFWKLYQNYEYDGGAIEFIIENYQDVLQNRTKLMSKPTYHAEDVIKQIDEWYKERGLNIWQEDNKFANRIDFSIDYSDFLNKQDILDIIYDKIGLIERDKK